MISGIDHVVIAVRDLDAGIQAYETLLGRRAAPRTERDGIATALLATGDVAVELMAPTGDGAGAARLRAALDDGGEGLKSLVFATGDIERAHRHAARVGLAPEEIVVRDAWRSFRLNTERTHGVRMFVLQRDAPRRGRAGDRMRRWRSIMSWCGAPTWSARLRSTARGWRFRCGLTVSWRAGV